MHVGSACRASRGENVRELACQNDEAEKARAVQKFRLGTKCLKELAGTRAHGHGETWGGKGDSGATPQPCSWAGQETPFHMPVFLSVLVVFFVFFPAYLLNSHLNS